MANLALVTRSREEAEDAVQEALVRAWIESDRGRPVMALRAWVAVVAVNLARSRLRRVNLERRATAMMSASDRLRSNDPEPGTAAALDLSAAVRRLPRRQREVVILHYYVGLDVAEVAAALGVGEGTAKKALHRARATMARALEEEAEDVTRR